jgi:hypothetical protein
MAVLLHLVARVGHGGPSLDEGPLAERLWTTLRRNFPDALAVVIMPDHIHLVAAVTSAEEVARRRLAVALGKLGPWWHAVPPPALIPNAEHLRRQIRYVSLNPCRARLVHDPLSWLWSTHRDVVGATVDPWVGAKRVAAALGRSPRGFAEAHHAYVSGDPAVTVEGTPFPRPVPSRSVPTVALGRVWAAAAAATRSSPAAIERRTLTRRLFVQLAFDQGWRNATLLARLCQTSRRAVYYALTPPLTVALSAARLCLGDARLLTAGENFTKREVRATTSGRFPHQLHAL